MLKTAGHFVLALAAAATAICLIYAANFKSWELLLPMVPFIVGGTLITLPRWKIARNMPRWGQRLCQIMGIVLLGLEVLWFLAIFVAGSV